MSKYTLIGVDGNAFMIMGYTARALRDTGLGNLVKEMQAKATSGDYYHLIAVCDEYIDKANEAAGYTDDDDDYEEDFWEDDDDEE